MKFLDLKEVDNSINLIHGNPANLIISGISHSDAPQENTFVFLKNKRFLNSLGRRSSNDSFLKSGVLVEESFFNDLKEEVQSEIQSRFLWCATIRSVNEGMCLLSKPFHELMFDDLNFQVDGRQLNETSIDPSAEIAQGVFIGEDVVIGKNVKILHGCTILPKVTIGDDCILFPNVTIYPYTTIGNRCRIHAGTVIGTDGFGYNFFDGKHQKIWHLAGVNIENDVEIGCNTMIDAGAFIATSIGNGSKIDNDVQISHNVLIKEHVIICGKTGLAGSVEVDDYCAFGAASGIAPGARLGKGSQVAGRAVVSENALIPPGEVVAGHPARPLKVWLRTQAAINKLLKK